MYRPDLSEQAIKSRAKLLAELISKEIGHDLSHGLCLKIVSQLFGFENWNTAKAMVKNVPKSRILTALEENGPIEAQTVGEVIQLLMQVPPQSKFRAYEHIDHGSGDGGETYDGVERWSYTFAFGLINDGKPEIAALVQRQESANARTDGISELFYQLEKNGPTNFDKALEDLEVKEFELYKEKYGSPFEQGKSKLDLEKKRQMKGVATALLELNDEMTEEMQKVNPEDPYPTMTAAQSLLARREQKRIETLLKNGNPEHLRGHKVDVEGARREKAEYDALLDIAYTHGSKAQREQDEIAERAKVSQPTNIPKVTAIKSSFTPEESKRLQEYREEKLRQDALYGEYLASLKKDDDE